MVGITSYQNIAYVAAFVGLAAPGALGDVKSVASYAVVTTEKANLRCGDGELFYKVAEVPAGTVLQLDGEGQAWSRVAYPSSATVYVKAEDVEVQGGIAKLTHTSKLKAANLASGWSGSWKALLASELPGGTQLKVIEPIKDGESGPIVGYRVAAPEQARAFVETRAIRKATEADSAGSKAAAGTKPTEVKSPEAKAGDSKPVEVKPVEVKLVEVKPADAKPGDSKPVLDAAKPAGETKGPVDLTQPVAANAGPAAAPAQPAAEPKATPVEEPPAASPNAAIYDLEPVFQRVWKEPLMTSEMDQLLGEYNRAIETVGPDSSRFSKQLEARRDAIKLRMELREKIRKQQEARAELEAGRVKVNEQLKIAEDGRVYTMIGQLQPSTVYDGKKLPLMFRVVSVGGVSPRTLGYLKDEKDMSLVGKVGAVVGVIGEAQLDRSLMLNVITPVRVDVLKPKSEVPAAPAAAPATPATPAASGGEQGKEPSGS